MIVMTGKLLILSVFLFFSFAACQSYQALPDNPLAEGVIEKDSLIILPGVKHQALIYYPGGLVSPYAYIKPLSALWHAAYTVVIVKMPFDLAVFDYKSALRIPSMFPDITSWGIGGHSLGGTMASRLVSQYPGYFDYLILFASFPADSDSLRDQDIAVLSISAELDGLVTREKLENSRSLLPEHTIFYEIPGGNHAGFGSYGPQDKDLDRTITEDEQQALMNNKLLEFLNSISSVSN